MSQGISIEGAAGLAVVIAIAVVGGLVANWYRHFRPLQIKTEKIASDLNAGLGSIRVELERKLEAERSDRVAQERANLAELNNLRVESAQKFATNDGLREAEDRMRRDIDAIRQQMTAGFTETRTMLQAMNNHILRLVAHDRRDE